jgi:hypothetical protein
MQVHKHSFNEGHKLHVLESKFHFIEISILHATKHVIQCVKKNMGKKCNWNYDNYTVVLTLNPAAPENGIIFSLPQAVLASQIKSFAIPQ